MMKNFLEIRVGFSKTFIHTSPPNILEGNGVVFENFTINHGKGGGGQNKLFISPQIFLKVMEQCSKTLPLIIEDYKCLLFIYRYFYLNFISE